MKDYRSRGILVTLAISAVAYSASSVLAYLAAVKMPIPVTILAVQVGFLPCALAFLLLGKESVNLKPSKSNAAVWAYGISFAVTGVLLFSAYKNYTLASIFPLLEGGVLVFLVLDFAFHRKKLDVKPMLLLAVGVAIVFLGTFFAESTGVHFDVSTLPYAVGMIIAGGIGYYALANKPDKISDGSKNLAFTIAAVVTAVLLVLYHGSLSFNLVTATPFLYGISAGFLLCVAFSMEIRAVKQGTTGNERKDMVMRNFVNNFTELDTVIVLVASVFIGSYTLGGLGGGALIVIGVVILGMIK